MASYNQTKTKRHTETSRIKTFIKHREAKQWAINQSAEWQKKVETDYDKMTIGELTEIYLQVKKKEVKHGTYLTAF